MNIEKIKSIDSKIKTINDMIVKKPYYGAGLTITLCAGKYSDGSKLVSVEVCSEDCIENILDGIKTGLEDSLKINLLHLKKDINEAIKLGYYKVTDDENQLS